MNKGILLCCIALVVPASLAGALEADADEEVINRTFEVKYKDFQDAVLIVTEIVEREGSERNSVRLQHLLKRITVTDVRRVVDVVAAALEQFDVPPRSVEVRMTLFMGTRDEDPEPVDEVFHSVVSELRNALRYTSYKVLGSLSVTAVEGGGTSVTLGSGYTIQFVVQRVDPQRRLIELSPLVLSRRVQAQGQDLTEQILTTTLNLTADQQMVMGASSDPSSDRALLLAIAAGILD